MDAIGREIDSIRVSLTNSCNLNCFYCHEEGNNVAGEDILLEKVVSILEDARALDISRVKFTGGEPLLRKDIRDIVSHAKRLGFKDIGMTTNGTLLNRPQMLKDAGLDRVNIGCDTLHEDMPKNLVVLRNKIIRAKEAGLSIKLNMVVMRGINEGQVGPMIDFCKENSVNLQLIELIDSFEGFREHHADLESIEAGLERDADRTEIRSMQNRKRHHTAGIFVEVVRPSAEFCRACSKIRITSEGKVRPCLRRQEAYAYEGIHTIEKTIRRRDSYGYG